MSADVRSKNLLCGVQLVNRLNHVAVQDVTTLNDVAI